MRIYPVLLVGVAALVGCDSILGIDPHSLEADGGGSASYSESGVGSESGPTVGTESGPGSVDSGPEAESGLDSGGADSGSEGGTDAGSPPNEGGFVPPQQCGGDAGACVSGGVFSIGLPQDDAGAEIAVLPDGGTITVTDDGFEFGGTSCDTTGMTCVTGAITP
jgi:hypothetical protein